MRKKALRILIPFTLASLMMFPFASYAKAHGHFVGSVHTIIAPGYGFYYPYWGWGWGYPYWGYGPYYPEYSAGKIKIKDSNKSDQVYIDGAYAGTAEKMKTITLSPGSYSVEIRQQNKDRVNRKVYVVAGKTVEIDVNS